jgi:hypothetical protein
MSETLFVEVTNRWVEPNGGKGRLKLSEAMLSKPSKRKLDLVGKPALRAGVGEDLADGHGEFL